MKKRLIFALYAVVCIAAIPAWGAEKKGNAEIDTAIQRGVEFLVKSQNADGSWGTGTKASGTEMLNKVPGSHDAFRVATTALAVMALREAGEKEAHAKGVEYLITNGEALRDDGRILYNVWSHTYALEALSMEMRTNRDPRLKRAVQWQLNGLERYETFLGGWNYYDFEIKAQRPAMEPTSFGTAAGLVAMWEAKQSGMELPQEVLTRGKKRLAEMRLPNGSFVYARNHLKNPLHQANHIRGSIGRIQSGNFALMLWEDKKTDVKVARHGLDLFFKEHDYIDMGRQRIYPHESWYATAPYYYYFGHYYAARLIEKLGPQAKKDYADKLAATIVPHQEKDGSWWDYPLFDYHKPYGTAYAVMTLLRCK